MQKKKPQLTVQPLARFKEPRYPRIGEVSADQALAENPYPFRASFKRCVATVGLTTVFTHLTAADEAQEPGNPFRIAESGLPFHSSPFGTGMPSYLSEEQARSVIDKVFREAGYQLQEDVLFEKGNEISFVADGYDPEKKIGYVWGDWNSLDPRDAVISWRKPRLDEQSIQRMLAGADTHPEYFERQVGDILEFILEKDPSEATKVRTEKIMTLSDPREQLEAFAVLVEQVDFVEDPNRLSLSEAEKLENDPEKTEYIALISQFDKRFEYGAWVRANEEKLAEFGELLKETVEAESDEEREVLKGRVDKMREELEYTDAKQALSDLEEAVRSYIEWAQSQGL